LSFRKISEKFIQNPVSLNKQHFSYNFLKRVKVDSGMTSEKSLNNKTNTTRQSRPNETTFLANNIQKAYLFSPEPEKDFFPSLNNLRL